MHFLKKITSIFILLLTSQIFAETNSYYTPEKKQILGYEQGHVAAKSQLLPTYNAPVKQDSKVDFFAYGSYIFFKARERGQRFADTLYVDPSNTNRFHNLHFRYKSGFKVGLGLNFDHDHWSLSSEYLNLHTTHKRSKTTKTPIAVSRLLALWRTQAVNLSEVSTQWKLCVDLLDLKLARKFYEGKFLILNPHVGLRGGKIDQNIKSSSIIHNTTTVLPDTANSSSWLVGTRAGIDSTWVLGSGFGFYGNLAASLFYQHFKSIYKETDSVTPPNLIVNARNNDEYINPNLDLAGGLLWDSSLSDNNLHISILAGYEMHLFFRQNMMRYLKDLREIHGSLPPGGLSLQGLIVSLKMEF